MHARQLAAFAGWIAKKANEIIQGNTIDVQDQAKYWVENRSRFQRWHAALKVFHSDISDPHTAHDPWPAIQAVVREIYYAEILTRIWATVMTEYDRANGTDELSGIANATFVGHVEVRNRAIQLLLRGQEVQPKVVAQLDQLRSRMERWTDLWLSMIETGNGQYPFAFDKSRVADFYLDNQENKEDEFNLMLTSFNSALNIESGNCLANPDLNQEVATSLINSIPIQRFERTGSETATRLKIEQSQRAASVLIDQLIAENDVKQSTAI